MVRNLRTSLWGLSNSDVDFPQKFEVKIFTTHLFLWLQRKLFTSIIFTFWHVSVFVRIRGWCRVLTSCVYALHCLFVTQQCVSKEKKVVCCVCVVVFFFQCYSCVSVEMSIWCDEINQMRPQILAECVFVFACGYALNHNLPLLSNHSEPNRNWKPWETLAHENTAED